MRRPENQKHGERGKKKFMHVKRNSSWIQLQLYKHHKSRKWSSTRISDSINQFHLVYD